MAEQPQRLGGGVLSAQDTSTSSTVGKVTVVDNGTTTNSYTIFSAIQVVNKGSTPVTIRLSTSLAALQHAATSSGATADANTGWIAYDLPIVANDSVVFDKIVLDYSQTAARYLVLSSNHANYANVAYAAFGVKGP